MTYTKIIKQDDLANLMEMTFTYSTNPADLDIPTDTPVSIYIQNLDTGDALTEVGDLTITDVSNGVVTCLYEWGSGDTATPGRYRAELRFELSSLPLTMPTVSYINLLIIGTLD